MAVKRQKIDGETIAAVDLGAQTIRAALVRLDSDAQGMPFPSLHGFESEKCSLQDVSPTGLGAAGWDASIVRLLLSRLEKKTQRRIKKLYASVGADALIVRRYALEMQDTDKARTQSDLVRSVLHYHARKHAERPLLAVYAGPVHGEKLDRTQHYCLIVGLANALAERLEYMFRAAYIQPEAFIPGIWAACNALEAAMPQHEDFLLIDMGALGTGFSLVRGRRLRALGGVALGSAHISRDLAYALQCDDETAERLKEKWNEEGLRPQGKMAQTAILSRAQEIFQKLRAALDEQGEAAWDLPVFMTGGGARFRLLRRLAGRWLGANRVVAPFFADTLHGGVMQPEDRAVIDGMGRIVMLYEQKKEAYIVAKPYIFR